MASKKIMRHSTNMQPVKKNLFKKAFTLVEILVVLIVIGLLASVVIVQVDAALTRSVAEKANTDVNLLNSAITRWRASYPSTNFVAQVTANATGGTTQSQAAFQLLKPFLGLSADIQTLEDFGRETQKLYTYEFDAGSYTFQLDHVEN